MSQDSNAATVAERLRDEPVVDVNGVLKPGGRAEVVAAVERWKGRGLRAYVLIARGAKAGERDAVWSALGADPAKDLLLVFDTRDWTARGWGLPEERIRAALASAEPALHQYFGRGLANAIDLLGQAATGVAAPENAGPSRGQGDERSAHVAEIVGGSVGALLLVGAFGFIVRRRNRRAREGREAFDEAKASADRAYSDLILAAEELTGEQASDLQLKGAELKKRLDTVTEEAANCPTLMSDPVTIGKIRQFENELAALRSTSLQQARRS